MNTFKIGFWGNVETEIRTSKDVEDWAELGANIMVGLKCSTELREKTFELLDACQEKGIKVILKDDKRTDWRGNYDPDEPEVYRRRFTEVYNEFGHHPAVFGFYVGDEPGDQKQLADSAAVVKIQKEVAPELTPYLNYLPVMDGLEEYCLKMPFSEWADKMIEETGLEVFSYDCYYQMKAGTSGWDIYFRSLRQFVEAAEKAGISAWTILLLCPHWDYRTPTEGDLRWQLSTAAVSGMKGALWYFLYMYRGSRGTSNYGITAFDLFGARTELFLPLARVNKEFLAHFGDFFANAKHIGTYHVGEAYGGYELYKPGVVSDLVLDITCEQGLPAVLGFFERDGKKYIAVVNNSPDTLGLFSIHVSKKVNVFERILWDGKTLGFEEYHKWLYYAETEDEIIGRDWFNPGQLKLYCCE